MLTGKHATSAGASQVRLSTVGDGAVTASETSSGSGVQNWTAGQLFIEKWSVTECRPARGGANFHQAIYHKLSESE